MALMALPLVLYSFSPLFNNPPEKSKTAHFTPEVKHVFSEENLVEDGFDFPVGKPDGDGYYNAQKFGSSNHLGDDWNGNGGGNTDLGDTIYNIGFGLVTYFEDVGGGWGNVIRIKHWVDDSTIIESLYAHCDEILIDKKNFIQKGHPIGTIGTAGGQYPAHLHFEIRSKVGMPIGPGYSRNRTGYLDPTAFIKAHR